MSFIVQLADARPDGVQSILTFVPTDQLRGAEIPAVDLAAIGFEAKVDQTAVVPIGGVAHIVVGLGPLDGLTAHGLRRAAALGARLARSRASLSVEPAARVIRAVGAGPAAQAIVEGLYSGAYQFLAHKSKPSPNELAAVTFVGKGRATSGGVLAGQVVGDAQRWARDQVNQPGGTLTPTVLAAEARAYCEAAGCSVTVHDLDAIREMRLGGLLGVNKGSANPPRFIEVVYQPRKGKSAGVVALVGKGITFDSGGLSIKPGAGMMTMKCDMGGAAAVLGAVAAAARLDLGVEVRCYVAATDNMTGPDATRPGDVLTIRNGKTIEVLNTDAEGRLVLADALSIASEGSPDAMVDLATLTGACKVALGSRMAGLMGNDDGWLSTLEAAASVSGEQVWRLPLPPEYRRLVDSAVADMKNIGGPDAGALTAGLILSEFVGEGIPWAHLDIAGPAWVESDDADITKGGTGYGVRLLVEALQGFAANDRSETVLTAAKRS